jgi:hypothetical protein
MPTLLGQRLPRHQTRTFRSGYCERGKTDSKCDAIGFERTRDRLSRQYSEANRVGSPTLGLFDGAFARRNLRRGVQPRRIAQPPSTIFTYPSRRSRRTAIGSGQEPELIAYAKANSVINSMAFNVCFGACCGNTAIGTVPILNRVDPNFF